jgi:hypothetical protein
MVDELPLSKPKQQGEIWNWQMQIYTQKDKIYLVKNRATPFLPEMLFPPSLAEKTKNKPAKFDIKHSVTKYDIYIHLNHNKVKGVKLSKINWFDISSIKKVNHSSLMTKILKKLEQLDKI